jgi:thiosulfate reductase/polysulfide reductase chain A
MQVEVSRRRFLQGSVALSIVGGTSVGVTNLFAGHDGHEEKGELTVTTKTGTGKATEVATLCEMCVNKCAAVARVENGIVTKLNPNPMVILPKTQSSQK